ncbi:helix-turn-helix transcriptional regulator [Mycobacterium paragordonae]|uniref:Helix-turn-helix domain-containing protein n=1 Tax=Mycobacterium paragordonae TaxID=1389713 RepID=A0ABQ1C3F9_9MYCO|nr:helix-turn-helix domain-containing protein [Mycobacterium paragordonae]GFG78987.1 hypothetical protein MPRG_22630 [Mycobacterium paragordonae]
MNKTAADLLSPRDPEADARAVRAGRPRPSPQNRAAARRDRRSPDEKSALAVLDPLLSCAEVAHWLNTTPGQLSQWRFHGEGPPFIKLGRAVRYSRSDVQAWLEANTRQQTG